MGLDRELRVAYLGRLYTDSDILQVVTSYNFELIAIDAPLTLPKGLCCLEEGCPCQPMGKGKSRSCERELRKSGIFAFPTTKKTFIKSMIYRGIRLKAELEARGYKVIEVYPYGSKTRLFGREIPNKTTRAGLEFLREHLRRLLPGITPFLDQFNHDMCDAAVAAYTAFLHSQGKTELCGDPEEGTICLPSLTG